MMKIIKLEGLRIKLGNNENENILITIFILFKNLLNVKEMFHILLQH